MKRTIRLNESKLKRVISETIKGVLNEGLEYEQVPAFEVLNDNFDGNWRAILTANLYDKDGKFVGKLRELHFIYDVDNNVLEGQF